MPPCLPHLYTTRGLMRNYGSDPVQYALRGNMPVSTMSVLSKEDETMYLQNLEEYVLDEEKIVTYSWLSKTLNIHVNLSKQLLNTFYSNEKGKGSVCATFVLAGKLQENSNYYVTVVGEDKLNSVKSLFESVSSEHIYSIQKTKNVPSWNTLFTANCQPTDCNASTMSELAAIRCCESVKRAEEEMAKLRICPQPTLPNAPKKSSATSSSSNVEEGKKSHGNEEEGKSDSAGKPDSKNKGSIASMFAAQSSKAATVKPPTSSSEKGSVKGAKKGTGISSFFSKVSKDDVQKDMETEPPNKAPQETSPSNSASEYNQRSTMDQSTSKKEETNSKKVKLDTVSSAATQTKLQDDKIKKKGKGKGKQKQEPKKRKRIIAPESESSDDDIFGEEEQSHSREPSPEPSVLEAKALESEEEDVIPPTPLRTGASGRVHRRRKVTKDKTYKDEEGYIVTEKVTEYESYSESDPETNDNTKKVKETKVASCDSKETNVVGSGAEMKQQLPSVKADGGTSKATTKKKSPEKSKQQSLMKFFKKKEN